MARNYSSTVEPKTLTANITSNTATQITLNNVTNLPSPPYVLVINPDTAKEEVVLVTVDQTGVTSPTLKVTRAIEAKDGVGVARSDHTIGDIVKHMIVGSDLQIVHDHFSNDNTTTGTAHGATGGVVGRTNSQTLTNKTINLTDNTIVGTVAQFNSALSNGDFATVSGTEELSNKTLTSPKVNENVVLTATATELNILDGATLSTAELNILDGVTSSTAELNLLDGVTATTTELNYIDGVTSAIQPQIDGKSGTAHTHAYLSTSGGTVSGDVAVVGIVSAVTNNGAGRGLNVRQPAGDGSDAIVQFTNNAGSAQIGSVNANPAGAMSINSPASTTINSSTAFWPAIRNNTVSATANVVASSDFQLRVATSSARYKKDIEDLDHAVADSVLNLRPVWFRSKESSVDDTEGYSHVGLIAEEVAEIQPRLVFFNTVEPTLDEHGNLVFDENGQQQFTTLETPIPEGVNYDKLGVYLLDIIKREKARSNDLEQRLIALEAKVAELEAK
jgi:hypothetical protein